MAAQSPKLMQIIDSSIVRAHRRDAGGKPDYTIGGSRGGRITKIHAIVDGCGVLVQILITHGPVSGMAAGRDAGGALK